MSESPESMHHTVHFTIDGRPFSIDESEQTARALLRLAGLDPEGYDLGEIVPGHPEPKLFEEGQQVHIHEGERFVSVRERAEVA